MRPHFKLTRFRTLSPKESQCFTIKHLTPDEAALYKNGQSHLYLFFFSFSTSTRQFSGFSMSLSWSVPSSTLLHAGVAGWGLQMSKIRTTLDNTFRSLHVALASHWSTFSEWLIPPKCTTVWHRKSFLSASRCTAGRGQKGPAAGEWDYATLPHDI